MSNTKTATGRVQLSYGIPLVMMFVAELTYLVVWGMILFPAGTLAGKVVWTMTCVVAMGLAVGGLTMLLVEGRHAGLPAFFRAALIFFAVGAYCAWLCSRIDARFVFFGGSEHSTLFIASGVLPAIVGAALFGWLVYGRSPVHGAAN